jgi:murein DD-endopeptidase MepM/ murein hydrolase activator NlpD
VKKTHDAFITSGFGWRWGRLHAGVDLAANEGTPIRASLGGTVAERVFDHGGYGWLLRVAHGDGWETRYAHCREIDKRLVVGKKVRRGQKVAEVGNTGRSFGPHLHFEVRRNGVPVDPLTCSDA